MRFHYQKDSLRGILRHLSSDIKKSMAYMDHSYLYMPMTLHYYRSVFHGEKLEKGVHTLGKQGRLTLDYIKILSKDFNRYK